MKLAEVLSKLPPQTELIAVSKKQPIEKMLTLYREGQKKFGENYVQELIDKARAISALGVSDVQFHFIGKLQKNKVKALLPWVDTIHSIDSLPLLHEIEKHAAKLKKKIRVYAQINIDAEPSKGGFSPEILEGYADELPGLKWVQSLGLMAIPNPTKDPREAFSRMKVLSEQWSLRLGSGLSMGMSGDFEVAIQYGATCVRIGTALFGERSIS